MEFTDEQIEQILLRYKKSIEYNRDKPMAVLTNQKATAFPNKKLIKS